MVQPDALDVEVCVDPDDDKFIAYALACGAKLIVSGDKHLLDVTGYRGIEVLKPRTFIYNASRRLRAAVKVSVAPLMTLSGAR
jgi:predicted nucleic acid-binding protein